MSLTQPLIIDSSGAVVYLPKQADVEGLANLAAPDPYVDTVDQDYPYGTRAVIGERVFHYGRASSDGITTPGRMAQNGSIYNDDGLQDAHEGSSTAVAIAVGDTSIIFSDTNSNHTANWFRRGWLIAFYSATTYPLQILSSTAAGTTSTYTMLDPFPLADGDGALFATVHQSIYAKMRNRAAGFSTQAAAVGMPLVIFAASYYGWMQTWGPCYCVATATFGNASYERLCTVAYDGSIRPTSFATAEQRVGHLLPQLEDDDSFMMLQIAP